VGGRLKNRLLVWRREKGLTLAEMAGLTGYSEAMISRAERGERVFSPMARVRVARRLGAKVAELFEPDDSVGGTA
jgi:transcriptional regulator with XRE-family HTH domain